MALVLPFGKALWLKSYAEPRSQRANLARAFQVAPVNCLSLGPRLE